MLTLIDNYDSFTYNLVHFLGELGASTRVYRNDKVTVDEVLAEAPEAIVLSPGPCDPDRAGICLELIARAGPVVPILGVCLGHQAIGQVYGGRVVRAPTLMHGKLSKVHHTGKGVFAGIPQDFSATRYHSLVVERDEPAGRAGDHRRDGRRRDHGPATQALSRAWRAVPSREHRLGARPSAACQLPRPCPRRAARARRGATEKRPVPSSPAPASPAALADLGPALRKVAQGETLTETEAADSVRADHVGRRDRGANRRAADGHARPRRDGRRNHRRRPRHAGARRQGARAGRRHRYLRHRRRRQGHAQYLHLCRLRGRRRGRAGRQARQPVDLLALGLGRRARRARRQYRVRAGDHRAAASRGAGSASCSRRPIMPPCAMSPRCGPSSARAPSSICSVRSPIRPARNIRSSACSARRGSNPSRMCSGCLGPRRAWVVHGADGLDELTTTGISHVAALDGGKISTFKISPKNAGLPRSEA